MQNHFKNIMSQLTGQINVFAIETSDTILCPDFLDPYVQDFPTILMCSYNEYQNFFHSDGRLKRKAGNFNCEVLGWQAGRRVFTLSEVHNPVNVCVNWARFNCGKM
jgi:hypothetical protein